MNRRALNRLTKRLAARRVVARRKGLGASAAVSARKLKTLQLLMKP